MNKKKIILTLLSASVLILELLPYGAVLRFANPDGEPWRKTFSYFDLINVGYANFAPFITAVLSCVLMVLIIIGWFRFSKRLNLAVILVSGFATATSLIPLFLGIKNFSLIGACISILLCLISVICFLKGES